mmetsp:Transcript_16476/g.56309  ORF Transcript_16476/g.56309 Transcript_16476/m.56309 type:complete len:264 (+) Transcript_16476:723-1514(+)
MQVRVDHAVVEEHLEVDILAALHEVRRAHGVTVAAAARVADDAVDQAARLKALDQDAIGAFHRPRKPDVPPAPSGKRAAEARELAGFNVESRLRGQRVRELRHSFRQPQPAQRGQAVHEACGADHERRVEAHELGDARVPHLHCQRQTAFSRKVHLRDGPRRHGSPVEAAVKIRFDFRAAARLDLAARVPKAVPGRVGLQPAELHAQRLWEEVGARGGPLGPLDESRAAVAQRDAQPNVPDVPPEMRAQSREPGRRRHGREDD